MAAIFDFRLTRTSDSILVSVFVLLDLENMGIAVGISLLSWLKAEIYVLSYLLPVLSRHVGYLVGYTLVLTPPSCSPAIFRKSQLSVSVNSKRLRNGIKNSGLWGIFTPTFNIWGLKTKLFFLCRWTCFCVELHSCISCIILCQYIVEVRKKR